MQKLLIAASALLAASVVVSGCSSAVNGSGQAGSSAKGSASGPASTSGSAPTTTAPSSSSSSTTSSTFPSDVAGLAAKIQSGNSSIKSAHIRLSEQAGSTSVVGTGTEQLSGGKVKAIDLTETVSGMTMQFRLVGGQVFAKVPQSVYPSTKPWLQISPTTTNAQLRQLYTSLQSALTAGTGDTIRLFVGVAKDLHLEGTGKLDGATVGHYALSVDIASLPSSFPNRDVLEQSGLTSIPVELFVDAQGRTRRVTEKFTIAGQSVSTVFDLTGIDVPVSISAPPGDQVEHV